MSLILNAAACVSTLNRPRQINKESRQFNRFPQLFAGFCATVQPMIAKKTALGLFLLIGLSTSSKTAQDDTWGPKVILEQRAMDNPVYAPLPEYPKEALSHGWGGFALYEVH